jgi:hypothetical protein
MMTAWLIMTAWLMMMAWLMTARGMSISSERHDSRQPSKKTLPRIAAGAAEAQHTLTKSVQNGTHLHLQQGHEQHSYANNMMHLSNIGNMCCAAVITKC